MDMSVIVTNEGVSDLLGWGVGTFGSTNIYGCRNMGYITLGQIVTMEMVVK